MAKKYVIKNEVSSCGSMIKSLIWRREFESADAALEEIYRYIRDDVEEVSLYEEKKADLVPNLKVAIGFNTDATTREWIEIWEVES